MDERGQQPKTRHRLAVFGHAKEMTASVAATSRYCGTSRTASHKQLPP